MKIVLATPVFPPEIGGPPIYIKELAERLRDMHEVVIVTYAHTPEQIPRTTLRAVSKDLVLPLRLFAYFCVLWKAARAADVIYVQNAMAAGLPAVFVGMMRRIPVVLKFVGDEAWEHARQEGKTRKSLKAFLSAPDAGFAAHMRMSIQGFVLRHVAMVTTPSAYLLDAISATYRISPTRGVVNYNAAPTEIVTTSEVVKISHQIVTTQRLVAWKGMDGVIRALAILAKRFPDVKLVIAGDGPEEEKLKALAKELALADRVTFLGRVSREKIWQLLKTSGVYVLNSTYEGLPHTVLESFVAGIPTVATNISGTIEAVENERSGLLVEPGDDRAFANAIARIFEDSSLREQIIAGAKKTLSEKFSWEKHLRELMRIFGNAQSGL